MARDLDIPSFQNRNLVSTEFLIGQLTDSRTVEDIHNEAGRQLAAIQMRKLKALAALQGANDIYDYADQSGDAFVRKVHERMTANHRSADSQADCELLHRSLLQTYIPDLTTMVRMGLAGLGVELSKDVTPPKSQKRGWLW